MGMSAHRGLLQHMWLRNQCLCHHVLPRLLSAWQIGGANAWLGILADLFTILYKIHNTELNTKNDFKK
jgi:hypothetical protein